MKLFTRRCGASACDSLARRCSVTAYLFWSRCSFPVAEQRRYTHTQKTDAPPLIQSSSEASSPSLGSPKSFFKAPSTHHTAILEFIKTVNMEDKKNMLEVGKNVLRYEAAFPESASASSKLLVTLQQELSGKIELEYGRKGYRALFHGSTIVVMAVNSHTLAVNSNYFRFGEADSEGDWFIADAKDVDIGTAALAIAKLYKEGFVDRLLFEYNKRKYKHFPEFKDYSPDITTAPDSTTEAEKTAKATGTLKGALRPVPTNIVNPILACTRHRIKLGDGETKSEAESNMFLTNNVESILTYPMVISGPSGSGKTVAALQLAPMMQGICQSQRKLVTVGVYLREYKRSLTTTNSRKKENTVAMTDEQIEAEAADIAFHALTSKIIELIEDAFGGGSEIRVYKSVHVHIVLDEIGGMPALVKKLVGSYAEFKQLVQVTYPELGLSLAIVGTGVDCSGLDGQGSIGHPLWRLFVQTSPKEIVKATLRHRHPNNDEVISDITTGIANDPLLSNLMGNLRCAGYIANIIVSMAWHRKDFSSVSQYIAQRVAEEYVASNAWRDYEDDTETKYTAILIATMALQGRGCHILNEEDITFLCKSVGAMDDRQLWLKVGDLKSERPTNYAAYATPVPNIHPLMGNAPKPLGPKGTELKAHLKLIPTNDVKKIPTFDHIRFHIPLSIALVAVIRYATLNHLPWPFSSDVKSPAATYEQTCSLIIVMIESALTEKGIHTFPTSYLFPQLKENAFDTNTETITAFSNRDRGMNPITITWPPSDRNDGIAQIFGPHPRVPLAATSNNASNNKSLAVEVASEAGAQNDVNIFGEGLIIGVVKSFYTRGTVAADVFVKRAQQMGYEKVKFTIPFKTAFHHYDSGHITSTSCEFEEDVYNFISSIAYYDKHLLTISNNELQFYLYVHHLSPQDNAAAIRSSLIREIMMDRLRKLSAAPASPQRYVQEALLLCCPPDVIPTGCSIAFEGQVEFKLECNAKPIIVTSDTIDKDVHDALNSRLEIPPTSTYDTIVCEVIPWKCKFMNFLGSACGQLESAYDHKPYRFDYEYHEAEGPNHAYMKAGQSAKPNKVNLHWQPVLPIIWK